MIDPISTWPDMDVEIIASMLNGNLRPDGWDIGALEHIADYLTARGQCIYDHDDPSLDWNQEYEENDMHDDGATGVEPLGEMMRREMVEVFTARRTPTFKWTIEVEIMGAEANDAFVQEFADLLARSKATYYEFVMDETRQPVRYDNCPF